MGRMHVSEGVVTSKERLGPGLWRLEVQCDGQTRTALSYEPPLPKPRLGDRVVLNTVAVDLGLGTGGYDFVMHVFRSERRDRRRERVARTGTGHMIKLRYTPWQWPVMAVEEEESPYHEVMRKAEDVQGMPVVILALHSQLAPTAAALREAKGAPCRIVYVMTDDAALPLPFSFTVVRLRRAALLDGTVTVGSAFGGDVEAMTVFSGLLAARNVLRADAVIVGPGPGSAGTGTPFGTPAVRAGQHADAVAIVGGRAIVAPRISFSDPRPRHRGVSDHTLTAFGRVALRRCTIVLPELTTVQHRLVAEQLHEAGVAARHRVIVEPRGETALHALAEAGIELRSMGRDGTAEKALFLAGAAAGFRASDFV